MMFALLALAFYLVSGLIITRPFLRDKSIHAQTIVGLSLGLVLFMWLPALFAYAFTFSLKAQYFAFGAAFVLDVFAGIIIARITKYRTINDFKMINEHNTINEFHAINEFQKNNELNIYFWVLVPLFTILAAYLQYTHILLPKDGALMVGQSTYGDLALHLGIATSLRNAPFPPEYSLLPNTPLAYPFLFDMLSTSLMLLGMNLRHAIIIPAVVSQALVFASIMCLAFQLTKSPKLAALTLTLLTLCGGFGFLYMFDMWPSDTSRIAEIFTGFYRTPTNFNENNIRWSNILADMWLPQRTFLGGWLALLPALILLTDERRTYGSYALLGIFAGALPLIHTHSFFALGLFGAGYTIALFIQNGGGRSLGNRLYNKRLLGVSIVAVTIAAAFALPQLVAYTFRQTSAEGFMRPYFNWVNTDGEFHFIDGYLFFWIKNVGPPLLLMIPALLNLDRRHVPVAVGAFTIFITTELIVFQPNVYDNNKLFYVWYLMMLPLALAFAAKLWRRMAGVRGRAMIGAAFVIVSCLSGALTIGREAVSEYQLFSESDARLAEYVETSTRRDSIFMTSTSHTNPIAALAGRRIVCGPDLYLYFHGLDYFDAKRNVEAFYADPENSMDILVEYGVDYVKLGGNERALTTVSRDVWDGLFEAVYDDGENVLYAIDTASSNDIIEP